MANYKLKTNVISAIKLKRDTLMIDVLDFLKNDCREITCEDKTVTINTVKGKITALVGDYLINDNGKYSVYNAMLFEQQYELVNDDKRPTYWNEGE